MTNYLNTKEKGEIGINAFIDQLAELLLLQIEENYKIGEAGGRAGENKKDAPGRGQVELPSSESGL